MIRLTAMLALLALGCPATVLRERDTYVAEMAFTDRLVREGAPSVRDYVTTRCACTNNVWRATSPDTTDRLCADHVEWWLVYSARWSWHHRMMLFNAQVLTTRPEAAPAIPPVTCTLPIGES